MISIQKHLKETYPENYLNALAQKHWEYLNPKQKTKDDYSYYSLIKKVKKILNECTLSNYIDEYAAGDLAIANRHKLFYEYLTINTFENLKRIIISRPSELENIKNELNEILEVNDFNSGTDTNPVQTKFGELLTTKIFDYRRFRSSSFCREIIEALKFNHTTCPYCNYQVVDIVDLSTETDPKKITKAYLDLDHFMPKSQNPFFALSFFNLIPSCHSCNATEKKDKPFLPSTHVNPYDKSFNDIYKFQIDDKFLLNSSIDNPITLELLDGLDDKTNEDLRLHIRLMNGAYNESLVTFNLYHEYQNKMHEDAYKESFQRLILNGVAEHENQILEVPRGKLTRDILKEIDEFGLIKD